MVPQTATFVARTIASDGSLQDVTGEAQWEVLLEGAQANQQVVKGVVTVDSPGSYLIRTSYQGKTAERSLTVTAAEAVVVDLEVSAIALDLAAGQSEQVTSPVPGRMDRSSLAKCRRKLSR